MYIVSKHAITFLVHELATQCTEQTGFPTPRQPQHQSQSTRFNQTSHILQSTCPESSNPSSSSCLWQLRCNSRGSKSGWSALCGYYCPWTVHNSNGAKLHSKPSSVLYASTPCATPHKQGSLSNASKQLSPHLHVRDV